MSRTMISLTSPCADCGHTRTLHERQWQPKPDFPCLFGAACRCQGYVAIPNYRVYVYSSDRRAG